MCPRPIRVALQFGTLLLLNLWTHDIQAGGSGLNVAVVVNQASSNSVALGNYYCERRGIPPENLFRITWPGGNTTWTRAEFESLLLNPLRMGLTQRGLDRQILYVVVCMDIPFAVSDSSRINSTTSALFYGFKDNTKDNDNSYARSEAVFGAVVPATSPGYSYLATMLTAGSFAQAKQLVDQGVQSDGTMPTQIVLLAKSSDPLRNIRYPRFDNAIFNTRLTGRNNVQRIDSDAVAGRSNLLGFQTGLANFSISPNSFIPGAMADSMTSYAGVIFGPNSQTTLLAFIHAGASGSYGTVTEPGAVVDKFPDPMIYFYQARGFSLAECYYQGIGYPYEGLVVGEPLAAPYRRAAAGSWLGPSSNAVLSGVAPLSLQFTAATGEPVEQVDLFIDGKCFQTMTNVAPQAGNQLTLQFAGGTASYTVPAGATIASVASGVAFAINATAASSQANVQATATGDRIEIHSLSDNRPHSPGGLRIAASPPSPTPAGPLLAGSAAGAASSLTTFLTAAGEVSLESTAVGTHACLITGSPLSGDWLQLQVTKTNGTVVTVGATNQPGGSALLNLVSGLATAVNTAPGLQDAGGLRTADVALFGSSGVSFNFQARSSGPAAAGMTFNLTGSAGLAINPASADLRENLGDLLPRNHIRVTAGSTNLTVTFPLNTSLLADGYHELTAVAYEGSHVRSQTRITIPVRVQNTSLSATLTLPGVPNPASVNGSYQVNVAANQGSVTMIRLLSTGGQLDEASGQSSATFTVDGGTLGVGLHPVWAEVETAGGSGYRTATYWLRLSATP